MRLLLFSDLHLDAPFRWAGPEVGRARRRALRTTLSRVVALADSLGADALCCAGDLYEHESTAVDTGEFLREQFAEFGRPVLLAPGNHDWYGTSSLYRQTAWTPNVVVFTEDRLTPHELADGFTVWGAAHRAPANTDGFLENFSAKRGGVSVALFHGSERSSLTLQDENKTPHAPFTVDQIPAAGLSHALVGHYHRPTDASWHTYPGNPDPLAFGERGPRGAVCLDFDGDGGVARTRHRVATSTVTDVTVDLSGVTHAGQVRVRAQEALASLVGVVRLTLTGVVAPSVDVRAEDLKDLTRTCESVDALLVRLVDVRADYDFGALAAEQTVRGQFIRDVTARLSGDQCRRVLTTGLRALDGRRNDLEVI